MVKGSTRQAVVVRSPDPELFEQAIFIVRNDCGGVTQEDVLRQAHEAVRACASERPKPFQRIAARLAWVLTGAAVTGLVWLITAAV